MKVFTAAALLLCAGLTHAFFQSSMTMQRSYARQATLVPSHVARSTERSAHISMMAEGELQKKRGRGLQVIDKVKKKEKLEEEFKEDLDNEPMWRVLLHNDPINSFTFVVGALVEVVGEFDHATGHELAWNTHCQGLSTITTTYKQRAESICVQLQGQGLSVSMQPDKKFKGGSKDDGDGGDGGGDDGPSSA
eukprot:CAMPEP_0113943348 /NCGR_PEP_ID=MMETSP1339-20121228/23197_1 /TAXON_ID=94617 /ORGANISM="Fibrocapsa japonica" /LENGTH=191 /DNA_ID=CAMNT_0000948193 /DNA_START=33 /DNA_END=608 /DNA_ORIENTATION=- /assembly_acc=CAM_ASM_000762